MCFVKVIIPGLAIAAADFTFGHSPSSSKYSSKSIC
jgi:hypothetical protein